MSVDILTLGRVGRDDVLVAGGKGANLGELVRSGFPVPPGFVVPAAACRTFFEHIGLYGHMDSLDDPDPRTRDAQCGEIRGLIEHGEIPEDIVAAVMAAHAALVGGRGSEFMCAVRSSGTAEDLGEASFAGQHETYYYVQPNRILSMIKHCWASLFSPEAVSYRTTQGMDHSQVLMAVVVQEMIPSQVSGVTFTANPVTGDRQEVVTESSWGMGAAIVDGRVTPDHYVFERGGLRLKEKRIAEKKFMVPARPEQGGSRLLEVPHSLRHKETLTTEQARAVSELALKAEAHFGSPQDVEWAMVSGQVFMLQSRPITVMGREDIGAGVEGRYVIFKPLIENFTAPLTPMTADMVSLVFAPPLMRMVRGWLYISLRHFRALMPYKGSDEELAQLIYGMDTDPPPMKVSWLKLPLSLFALFLAYLVLGVLFARSRRMPAGFMDRFRELAGRVDADQDMGPFQTAVRLLSWCRFFDPIGNQVFMINLGSMRYIQRLEMLGKLLRRWVPEVRKDAESLLASGSEGVRSAEMGRGIWNLAKTARKHPVVREILEKSRPEQALSRLKAAPEAQAFLQALDGFFAVNGHRGLKELELASARWEEDPSPVLGMVRNYLLVESDPDEHERKVRRVRADMEARIRSLLGRHPLEKALGLRWRLIQYTANRAKFFARQRENSRFYHIMGFYSVRKKVLRAEARLIAQGRLKCRGDVFFLHLVELEDLQAGRLGWLDVEDRIRKRRMEYIRLSKTVPPMSIGVRLPSKEQGTDTPDDSRVLRGQSASPGQYEGTAHVILDPSLDLELKPGEVLIAPYTDPAWTPLFLTAGAAVVEVGSYLSHAGTVAREYGMPCVVDLPGCTKIIQTGRRVRVDGDRGVVHIVAEEEGEGP